MNDRAPEITVLMFNLGGPDSLEAVEPFLKNLFSDPDIIDIPLGKILRQPLARLIARRRAPKVQHIFRLIGGASPILEITRRQASALQTALGETLPAHVRVAMRYWHPFLKETLLQIPANQQVLVLPLFPHYSITTTGSGFNEIQRIIQQEKLDGERFSFIADYHDHPAFIRSWAQLIRETLVQVPADIRERITILFSAHGVPQKVIRRGDPYQRHVEESVRLIMREAGLPNAHLLAYQSKVGPVRWLEPSVEQAFSRLAAEGRDAVLVVPVSFVSEHSETLYELDILLKDIAQDAGIRHYYRVPALNSHPAFIQSLKEVVLSHANFS